MKPISSKTFSVLGIVAAMLLTTVAFVGCGTNTQNLIAIGGLIPTFRGPGSVWNVFVNDNAGVIELTHQASMPSGVDYEGVSWNHDYTATSGFNQLTVFSAGPDMNGPDVGAVTSAMSISGYVFFLAPYSAADTMAMIPPVCPTADLSMSFIKLRQPSGWAPGTGHDSFGTLTYTAATGATNLVNDFNLATSGTMTSDAGAAALSNAVGCNVGELADGSNEVFVSSNGAIVHKLSTDEVYFGVVQGSAPAVSALSGSYAGYLYQASGPTNQPVSITLDGTTNTTALNTVTDVTTGTTTTGTTTIALGTATLSGTGTSGFIGGTINFGGGNKPLICLAQTAAGGTSHILIACNGYDGTGFVSLLLTSH